MSQSTTRELATVASRALVQDMQSAQWALTRTFAVNLLGRNNAARESQMAQTLDDSRASLLSGTAERSAVEATWQARLEEFMYADAAAETRVRNFVTASGQPLPQPASLHQQATASGNAQVNQAGRDIRHDNSRRTSFGGPLAVFAVIAVLLIVGGFGAVKIISFIGGSSSSTVITEDSSCGDYLLASTEEREHAVKSIGIATGASGAGNPMARLNVDYSCGQQPSARVGDVIARQNY
ncbi:hypothetical protein [Catellatospora methionotrophica]|uniref:hypothetical protein n=1 Tax=Catellatospora methionotrophica TaxID=121620 RepID=UPI0033D26017